MSQTEWHKVEDEAYRERIGTYTLSELEDVYTHLDRMTFPQRYEMVRKELEERLRGLDRAEVMSADSGAEFAGFFRRLWAGLVDLFVQVLILGGLFLVGKAAMGLMASFQPVDVTSGGRPESSPFLAFLEGLMQGDPEAWTNATFWREIGLGALGFLTYKALLTVPAWARSGSTPGMREVGVRLESVGGGRISRKQALIRFCGQHLLLLLTVGVSGLWMLWDRQKQTLHDKLARTRMLRSLRSWEKPVEIRMYDD